MVGDPIADLIVRIKNAGMAGKDSITVPFSKMKFEIANVLKNEGYLRAIEIIGKEKTGLAKKLELGIAYGERDTLASKKIPKVNGVERVSKPSRRMYISSQDIAKLGRGTSVLSTTKGIISGKTAKEKGVGGEILFKIW